MFKKICKREASHYIWGAGCDSWVFVDADALSVKMESMPPKTKENAHYHLKASQFFYLTKGEALFHIKGEKVLVSEGEGIQISPELVHFIENTSDEAIDFLVISQPTTANDRFTIEL